MAQAQPPSCGLAVHAAAGHTPARGFVQAADRHRLKMGCGTSRASQVSPVSACEMPKDELNTASGQGANQNTTTRAAGDEPAPSTGLSVGGGGGPLSLLPPPGPLHHRPPIMSSGTNNNHKLDGVSPVKYTNLPNRRRPPPRPPRQPSAPPRSEGLPPIKDDDAEEEGPKKLPTPTVHSGMGTALAVAKPQGSPAVDAAVIGVHTAALMKQNGMRSTTCTHHPLLQQHAIAVLYSIYLARDVRMEQWPRWNKNRSRRCDARTLSSPPLEVGSVDGNRCYKGR